MTSRRRMHSILRNEAHEDEMLNHGLNLGVKSVTFDLERGTMGKNYVEKVGAECGFYEPENKEAGICKIHPSGESIVSRIGGCNNYIICSVYNNHIKNMEKNNGKS